MSTLENFTICLNIPSSFAPGGFRLRTLFPSGESQPHSCEYDKQCVPIGIKAFMHSTREPICIHNNDLVLLLEGHIFNLDTLWNSYNNHRVSGSGNVDATTTTTKLGLLLNLYLTYGMDYLLQLLDGTFVMVLIDQRPQLNESNMYVVSDPMGARPLYTSTHHVDQQSIYTFSTEKHPSIGGTLLPMGCYETYTLPHVTQTKWHRDPHMSKTNVHIYHALGRSGGMSTNYIANAGETCLQTKETQTNIRNMLQYHLECAIDKRFDSTNSTTKHVVCIAYPESPDEVEFQVLCRILTKICQQRQMTFECRIPTTLVPEREGPEPAEFAKELVDSLTDPIHTRVFMPSILMSVETTIIHRLTSWSNISQNKCVSHPSIQYDYELRNEIRNMAANHLLPNVFEPFKSQGILVEFPLLEASWIDVYLSVNCHYRFGHPMEELYQVSLHNTPGNLSKSTFHSDFSLEVVI
jgi:hypothetical protein